MEGHTGGSQLTPTVHPCSLRGGGCGWPKQSTSPMTRRTQRNPHSLSLAFCLITPRPCVRAFLRPRRCSLSDLHWARTCLITFCVKTIFFTSSDCTDIQSFRRKKEICFGLMILFFGDSHKSVMKIPVFVMDLRPLDETQKKAVMNRQIS